MFSGVVSVRAFAAPAGALLIKGIIPLNHLSLENPWRFNFFSMEPVVQCIKSLSLLKALEKMPDLFFGSAKAANTSSFSV